MSLFPTKRTFPVSATERTHFLLPSLTLTIGIVVWFLTRVRKQGLIEFAFENRGQPAIVYVVASVILALAAFTLAHVLDLSSQFIVERLLADKLLGFPHERIVPIACTTPRYRLFLKRKRTNLKRKISFYEGTKGGISSLACLTLFDILYRSPQVQSSTQARFLILALTSYWIACFFVACISLLPPFIAGYWPRGTYGSRLREVSRGLKRLRRPTGIASLDRFMARLVDVMILALTLPAVYLFDALDRFIRAAFRLNAELDAETYKKFLFSFRKRIGIAFQDISNNDRFWLIYLYVLNSRTQASRMIIDLRTSANFCRIQMLAMNITAILLASSYRIDQPGVESFLTKADMYKIAILLFFASWFFYWKFLQSYYAFTKLTFRAFVALSDAPKKTPKVAHSKVGEPSGGA